MELIEAPTGLVNSAVAATVVAAAEEKFAEEQEESTMSFGRTESGPAADSWDDAYEGSRARFGELKLLLVLVLLSVVVMVMVVEEVKSPLLDDHAVRTAGC